MRSTTTSGMRAKRLTVADAMLNAVGVRAIKLGRRAGGSELNGAYFKDQVHYLQAAERAASIPSLFDLEEPETEAA